MKLENYISDLLYRYDCVILPEFGGFLANHHSAIYDEKNFTFHPPRKSISFNQQIDSNDGLLVNYIALKQNIDYSEALNLLQNEVKNIKEKLIATNEFTLNSIGNFTINEEGKFNFSPIKNSNFLSDSFGLDNFTLKTVDNPKSTIVNKQNTMSENIDKPIFEITKNEEVNNNLENSNEEQYDFDSDVQVFKIKKNRGNTVLKYAAIAIIGFGLVSFLASNFYKNYENNIASKNHLIKENEDEKVKQKFVEANIVDLESITLAAKTLVEDNSIEENKSDTNNEINKNNSTEKSDVSSNSNETDMNSSYIEDVKVRKASTSKSTKEVFYIIAGVYKIKENADKQMDNLRKRGFSPIYVGKNSSGNHQVAFTSYKNRAQATIRLDNIIERGYKDAWLLPSTK